MVHFTDTIETPKEIQNVPVELIFETVLDDKTHISKIKTEIEAKEKTLQKATKGLENAELQFVEKSKQQKKEAVPIPKILNKPKVLKDKKSSLIPIEKIPKLLKKPKQVLAKETMKPVKKQSAKNDDFEPQKLAALLNKIPDKAIAGKKNAEIDVEEIKKIVLVDTGEGSISAQLTHTQLDLLKAQISRCWNPPIGIKGAEKHIASLFISLNRDGSLTRRPVPIKATGTNVEKIFVESAVRAVMQCAPYNLPVANYKVWKELRLNFDPSALIN